MKFFSNKGLFFKNRHSKKLHEDPNTPIEISPISHTTNADINYFQNNLSRGDTNQKVT